MFRNRRTKITEVLEFYWITGELAHSRTHVLTQLRTEFIINSKENTIPRILIYIA